MGSGEVRGNYGAGCDEVSDIDDLINLTYNLDCYDIIPDVHDESDLGYYYVHEPYL